MDVIRFTNPNYPTRMQQAVVVNGLDSKMWIERYREAGEFTFVGKVSSGIKEQLPIGSFVSHLNTTELMIIEDHEINEERGKEPELVVTGRGLETFFDHRIVGAIKNYSLPQSPSPYSMASANLSEQARILVRDHVSTSSLVDPDNAFPYLDVSVDSDVPVGTNESRTIKTGGLYARLVELLAIDNLGQRIIRPGPWVPYGSTPGNTVWMIHAGVDRSNEILISHTAGEIESADYFWSNRKIKTAAVVSGKWVEVFVTLGEEGYGRRVMYIDGTDLDQNFDASEVEANRFAIEYVMQQRGLQALRSQKQVAINRVEVAKNSTAARYRTDFYLGDIVTVSGGYSEETARRVSEYVEIEDQNGAKEYPTLTIDV